MLWISGGPGKGKTMISIYLTEELEGVAADAETADAEEAIVIYFFCSSEDSKRNTAAAVLRGLLWQLTGKRPELTNILLTYFERPEEERRS